MGGLKETAILKSARAGIRVTAAGFRALALDFIVSTVLLIPCFWQPHIACADLPSHLYNAWLRTRVAAGLAPGLFLVQQKTNFLVDDLLALLLRNWGVSTAEHVMTAVVVLIVFWGSLRFVATASGRNAWVLAPLLAMLTYGLTFRWGFFNFYLSFGLCLWAASLAWSSRPRASIRAALLLILAVAAHAMPPFWMVCVLGYLTLHAHLGGSARRWLFAACATALVAAHFVIPRVFRSDPADLSPQHTRIYLRLIGLWQVAPSKRYFLVALLVLLVVAPALWRARKNLSLAALEADAFVQLVLLHIMASALLPDTIFLPSYPSPFGLIGVRISLMTAALLTVLLARLEWASWQPVAFAGIACLFFTIAFFDERAVNRAQERVRSIVASIPEGARVIMPVRDVSHGPALFHFLDLACIGHCYDYVNYEPSSGQFRLRAAQRNPYVMGKASEVIAYEAGQYVMQRQDPPLFRIHLCGGTLNFDLCVDSMRRGQRITIDSASVDAIR